MPCNIASFYTLIILNRYFCKAIGMKIFSFVSWYVYQCREVARIHTGMPVYTGVWKKSPVFRPYFCDFGPYFCDFSDIERYL